MEYKNELAFAKEQDAADELTSFRKDFYFPAHNGKEVLYFTGNSLGLQPKGVKEALEQELNDWAQYGVEGHLKAKTPWYTYHETCKKYLAPLVGAKEHEVSVMNGLTVNLHLLFVSFYRPSGKRTKILCEAKPFPSDYYMMESQLAFHGLNVAENLIELQPQHGETELRQEDILQAIETHKDELALVFFGGVNYYTGQVFAMEEITTAAHKAGAVVGFDLAHGIGNIKLDLHAWQVDFAAWCTYKYLNSGPGSVSGIFVHEKHAHNKDLPRFAGWWGYPSDKRFQMKPGFEPAYGADGWQLSNAPVFSIAPHHVSLEIFNRAGIDALIRKRDKLTGYLAFIIKDILNGTPYETVFFCTPSATQERGCQLSLHTGPEGKNIFTYLSENGVVADWREPGVIRFAPVPLYNSFEDIYRFGEIFSKALKLTS